MVGLQVLRLWEKGENGNTTGALRMTESLQMGRRRVKIIRYSNK
jgi:hypothetical protein